MVLPIHRLVVSLRCNNLRSKIVWRSAECPCDVGDLLGEAKVRNLEVSMPVEEEVFGLQVTVYDIE